MLNKITLKPWYSFVLSKTIRFATNLAWINRSTAAANRCDGAPNGIWLIFFSVCDCWNLLKLSFIWHLLIFLTLLLWHNHILIHFPDLCVALYLEILDDRQKNIQWEILLSYWSVGKLSWILFMIFVFTPMMFELRKLTFICLCQMFELYYIT